MVYRVQTPWWLRRLVYPALIWKMPREAQDTVYLTFDDGPHPAATRFVLDALQHYNATATFFCIGKNVTAYPELYREIIRSGHTTGNHTQDHVNGWKCDTATYLANIREAANVIESRLFRPPYGRIRRQQIQQLLAAERPWKIYMWDVLSGDFDKSITGQQCLDNVIKYLRPGSIVTFHDSEKAWERMRYALPHVLEHCRKKGWIVKALPKH